jgi:hypothetical protein
MADTRERTAERVKRCFNLLALVMAGVLAVVGVLWVKNLYAIGGCSYAFFSVGFFAEGVFSVGIVSVGVFSVGVISFGVFSFGLLCVGLLLGWPWCLIDRLLKRYSVRRSMVLVAVVGVCAGGLMHLLNQTVLRDYLDRQIGYATYSSEYVEENRGKVIVEIPEVYELANVILAISDHGQRSFQVHREGDYYEKVMKHFGSFSSHQIVEEHVFSREWSRYLGFRTNSYCYVFDDDDIKPCSIHRKSSWRDTFKPRIDFVENFARASRFRDFYRDNISYYQEQIDKYSREVPVKQMWQWLEQRFPARYDCYRIVLSPLIGGTHNTQYFEGDTFRETVMFVAMGPILEGEIDDSKRMLTARIVFTEIDHNYVNPVTDQFWGQVNNVFGDLDAWNHQASYRSPYKTFNEYMTWAVFMLYCQDTLKEGELLQEVNDRVVNTMVNSRKFVRFREFNEKLLELYEERGETQTLVGLYPRILDWAETLQE